MEQLLNNINSEIIKIFIISMLPITELRFSIPYGILYTNLNTSTVVITSIVGNISIGIFTIYLIPSIFAILSKVNIFKQLINFIISRTKRKSKIIENLKYYGLIIFVSIPLPLTGVWTGALASQLLGLNKSKSIWAIIIGVLLSSTIVTSLTILGKYTL